MLRRLQVTPWRAFLRNVPVRALAYTHFCNNWWVPHAHGCRHALCLVHADLPCRWLLLAIICRKLLTSGDCAALHRFHYTMLAWLPTYFTDTLSLNLSQAAQVQRCAMCVHHTGC